MKHVNLSTFDDTKFGKEIQEEWGMSMIDAMWYCQCREEGHSPEEVYDAWVKYQADEMKEWEKFAEFMKS
jgi:hypothetical protein